MPHAAKPRICLVCWDETLRDQHAAELTRAGFAVTAMPRDKTGGVIGYTRHLAPSAVVIDLDRLPSRGREVGMSLRASRSTRHIPIVFAGGPPEKIPRLKTELPDATYSGWDKLSAALKQLLANPPEAPMAPPAHMQRWATNDLPRKLGIVPQVTAAILNDRHGIGEILGNLPAGVTLTSRITRDTCLALFIATSPAEVQGSFDRACAQLNPSASFWIFHPKSNPRRRIDFNQNHVRELGLAAGFVDYKVAGINDDWSALKFAKRKTAGKS
jgi:CheY-like chemotaxis protein